MLAARKQRRKGALGVAAGLERRKVVVAVAPNGARKTKADHPLLPITAEELARTAAVARVLESLGLATESADGCARRSPN